MLIRLSNITATSIETIRYYPNIKIVALTNLNTCQRIREYIGNHQSSLFDNFTCPLAAVPWKGVEIVLGIFFYLPAKMVKPGLKKISCNLESNSLKGKDN